MERESGKRLDILIKEYCLKNKGKQCFILNYQEIVTEDMQKNEALLKDMTIQQIADYYGISYGQTALYLRIVGLRAKRIYRKSNGEPKKERKPKMMEEEHQITLWASSFNKGRIRYVYYNMLKRCYKSTDNHYYRYGARGITVCDEWRKDCKVFYKWAKESGYTQGLQLDRIDNDKGYCPDNCRWVTAKENSLNRCCTRWVEYNGEKHTLKRWADITGIEYQVLADRIYRYGWTIEKALTTDTKHDWIHNRKS